MIRNELLSFKSTLALAGAICFTSASGQSFNIDLSIQGDPQIGGGAPSAAFGGANDFQLGVWHEVSVVGDAPWLLDLNGVQRNVSISIAASNPFGNITGGGYRNLSNTGDYARLLNDARYVDGLWATWTFHGLTNGHYRTVVYAVRPFPTLSEARVSVNGGPEQIATGPMPGNQFSTGITHVIQDTVVTDGTLEILVSRNLNDEIAACNGFQIMAVPEPSTVVLVTCGIALTRIRKCRS